MEVGPGLLHELPQQVVDGRPRGSILADIDAIARGNRRRRYTARYQGRRGSTVSRGCSSERLGRDSVDAKRDSRDPLSAFVGGASVEHAVTTLVLELRRRAVVQAAKGIGRRNLSQETEQLRRAERLLGQRYGRTVLDQRGQLVLNQA